MYRALIIYAPAEDEIKEIAGLIQGSINSVKYLVTVKEAAQASIPDMAAADLILLGSKPQGRAAIHSDFSEIIRALEGVNLAGRLAGIFALDNENTLTAFKRALKDSQVGLNDENLLLLNSTAVDRTQIKAWIDRISAKLEKKNRGC